MKHETSGLLNSQEDFYPQLLLFFVTTTNQKGKLGLPLQSCWDATLWEATNIAV